MMPLIGIPCRTLIDGNLTRYGVLSTYTRAVELAGGAPVAIPLDLGEETLHSIFARIDGLLLAGGNDVHPREYGEELADYCGDIEELRDRAELRLTAWALEGDKPILGICRGVQVLNVAAGGSLYQDLHVQLGTPVYHQHRAGEPHNRLVHSIELDPNSRVARALGDTSPEVNSLHHQSVKQVAPSLKIVGRSPDGIVEALEAGDGRFVVGVQFHPEWLLDDDARMLNLFREFVQASEQHVRTT